MAPPTRKFNPGFLTDDELVASYCVRTTEFDLLIEVLRECTGHSNAHQIVIGPRGSGKTSLLLRVAAEARRDTALSTRYFPVTFAEESYEVGTAGEFWLECLTNLAAQAPRGDDAPDLDRTVEELRAIRDDQILSDRCLGALLDFADRECKRLVLLVENLNMLFGDMADPVAAGWRLRKVLQTEPRIIVFASATSRFDEIDNSDRALYELFRDRTLRPLDRNQCAVLWESVSGRHRAPETIRSLQILTGGSPRLISIVARFGGGLSFRDLMSDLFDLVDDHTEYFKSHIESLPAQERRVYLALAALWKPATTREIANHARLETSTCSAQLARLGDRGVVQVAGGSARRKQYYLTERLYNIYYLLRRRRGPDRFVEALIHFMEACYSPPELKDISTRMVHDAAGLGAEMRSLHRIALKRLMELPSLAEHRHELLGMMPAGFVAVSGQDSAPVDMAGTVAGVQADGDGVGRSQTSRGESAERAAKKLFETTVRLNDDTRAEDTVATCDEIVRRFGDSEIPGVSIWVAKSLVNRGAALSKLNRPEDALADWDEVVSRFGESETAAFLEPVAKALVNKGGTLGKLNRPQDALAVCEEVVRRFGESETPALLEPVASALANKGAAFLALNRPQDALAVSDDMVRRFGESESPALLGPVASILVHKGAALGKLNRPQDALAVCEEVVRRFGKSETPSLLEAAAKALANKGAALYALDRPAEALAACDEVVCRFGESEILAFLEPVAKALMDKVVALLGKLDRPENALAVCDEVVRRFGDSKTPALLEPVASALVNKTFALYALNRLNDAVAACDEIVRRFGESGIPALIGSVAKALLNKGTVLSALNRPEDAVAAWDEMVRRFGESETLTLVESIAKALVNKGIALEALDRPEDALTVYDEVVRRFGDREAPVLLEAVASALMNKGTVLHALHRPDDALAVYDEVVRRFGKCDVPDLLEPVANALANKGAVLHALHRPDDALAVCDEVVRRFEKSDVPALLGSVASALVNRGSVLNALHRPDDALAVYNEVVRRFGDSATPVLLGSVAIALMNKGAAFHALSRTQDALHAYDEVVRRFGDSEIAALRMSVSVALLRRADIEITSRRYETAAETAARVLDGRHRGSAEQRFQGHVIRARAILASGGDRSASEPDVEAVLALLPELGPIPREAVTALLEFSVALGPERMCELIQASPSPHLLLPLTTALERELGREPRVAREVDEVAQDIRQTLATLRANRTRQGPPPAISISTARTRSSRP